MAVGNSILKGRRRVLLLFAAYDPQHHKGIIRYAREAGWIVHSDLLPVPLEEMHYDGIISRHHADETIMSRIKALNIPTVDLYYDGANFPLPRVLHDEQSIGKVGADHLIAKGYLNLCYVVFKDTPGDIGRMQGFRKQCQQLGRSYEVLNVKEFRDWIAKAKLPVGIMTGDDTRAVYLSEVCEEIGQMIPEQVGILGADNDSSELCQVPLSSVNNSPVEVAYQAAKLLDSMMDGNFVAPEPVLIPPKGVIERRSTDRLGIDDLYVAAAMRFIIENFREKITLEEVAASSGLSRRRLDDHFRQERGDTISAELLRVRLTEAKRLLKETKRPLQLIANQAGLNCSENLIRIFRRELGMTPGQLRSGSSD